MIKKLPILSFTFFLLLFFVTQNTLNAKTIRFFAGPTPDAKGILYVKKGSNGDGSSWNNALGELITAIESTNPAIVQIWVSSGSYTPMFGASFILKRDVKIYGGFAGTENDLSQRDLKTNISILRGLRNSVIKTTYLTSASILDGFTITEGYAVVDKSDNSGSGGGINNLGSDLTISNCIFTANEATAGGGGGIYNYSGYPKIVNCTFNNNKSGAISNSESSPTITNCTFEKNISLISTLSNRRSTTIITNSNFIENSGQDGGAVYNELSTVTFTNCNFLKNISTRGSTGNNGGAAIYSVLNCTIKIYNCNFLKNAAARYGGALTINNKCNVLIANSLFANNTAQTEGNEIYSTVDNTVNIINSTFVNSGVNALTFDDKAVNFTNSIVWAQLLVPLYFGTPFTFKNSLLLGLKDTSNGNIDATGITDTQIFKSPSTEDYTLLEGGIAVNKGNNTLYDTALLGSLDLSGKSRINEIIIDLGAYESRNGSLGIAEPNKQHFTAYPNPVKEGVFYIENSSIDGNALLYDISGNEVKSVKIENGKANINVNNLPKGIYLLKTSGSKAFKIMVE
ncbi:T9SS type A sorting domain-containing protein [Flavobacterium sp. ACN6]|uniref:T9SS type A sorting domain-containing protein n=1 Tax=Flavobacterium sp. ACN6 TaxID=1920426 RepID=UPI000BB3AF7F|nr:T9SS type A sorting domain-containing protein [Flavobacterium sp. ACN6]PBJ12198.1 hypothetical protein BSF42_21530 [Flavobacterium sp. ACN6]